MVLKEIVIIILKILYLYGVGALISKYIFAYLIEAMNNI